MITAFAILLSIVVFAISALHIFWGLGSHWPCASEAALVRTAGGTPGATKMYPPASCFAVAALLAGVALWPLFAVGLLPEAWPRWLILLAGVGIAVVFVSRGLAGYTSPWRRRFSAEPFASLDRLAYSPLCLGLGAGYLTILIRDQVA